jgi:hypothetical protein
MLDSGKAVSLIESRPGIDQCFERSVQDIHV